jgi:hypothetical protein
MHTLRGSAAGLTLALIAACAGEPQELLEVPNSLFVPERATQVEYRDNNGAPGVAYSIQEPYPASAYLCDLSRHLERHRWRVLRPGVQALDDELAEQRASREWSTFADATRRPATQVHQWTDDWLSPEGDIARYFLRYEYSESGAADLTTLRVNAVAVRSDAARRSFGTAVENLPGRTMPAVACAPTPSGEALARVGLADPVAPGLPFELGELRSLAITRGGAPTDRIVASLGSAVPDLTVVPPGDPAGQRALPSAQLTYSARRRRGEPGVRDGLYVTDVAVFSGGVRHRSWGVSEPRRLLFHWSDGGQPAWRVVADDCRAADRRPAECRTALDDADLAFVSALATAIRGARRDSRAADDGPHSPLFGESYHAVAATRMVVRDTLLAMPPIDTSGPAFAELPGELRRRASGPVPTAVRLVDPRLVPSGVRIRPAASLPVSGHDERWSAFREREPASAWLAFSDALVTTDGLDALIYYDSVCGAGTCGESGYVWVRRDSLQVPWRLVKKLGIVYQND